MNIVKSIAHFFATLSIMWSGAPVVTPVHISTPVAPVVTPVQEEKHVAGSFNPSGGGTYRLSSSIGSSDATIHLSSFKEPISNISYTMSYLNTDIGYGTLAPQATSYSEFVSFSGITQNANGTADLTGVTRGLSRTPGTGGCVASSTLRTAHAGQTVFILSNSPCFYSEYMTLRGAETVSGVKTFASTSLPKVELTTTDALVSAATNTLATVNYVNNTAAAGAANASETVKGLVEMATAIEQASSTALGGTGAQLAIRALYASSTPTTGCDGTATAGSRCVVVASTTGKLSQNYLPLTEAMTLSGLITNSGGYLATASSTHTATTTDAGDAVFNKQVYGLSDYFSTTTTGTWTKPTQVTASSTVLVECWGGGGAGSGADSGTNSRTGGGGGGAYLSRLFLASNLTSTVAVTIGAGGTGVSDSSGNAGGNTTFGSYLIAYGGGGGGLGTAGGGGGGGGALGAGGNSTSNTGASGGGPLGSAASSANSGLGGAGGGTNASGGASAFGGGGGGSANTGGGSVYGGGGGGGGQTSSVSAGGTSLFGGNGGASGNSATGGAGSVPGGGGGGTYSSSGNLTGGAGAKGQCNVLTSI